MDTYVVVPFILLKVFWVKVARFEHDFLFCVIRRGSNCRLFDVLPLDSLTKEYIYGGIQNKMGPIMICCTSYKAATAVK